jgi:hypothetical protein
MRMDRRLRSKGVMAALFGAAVLTSVTISGQAPTVEKTPGGKGKSAEAADPSWTAPRTPWGDPDLEGTWSNWDRTPFEMPNPNPDPAEVAANKALRAERYGKEGRGDGIAGGMADVHFGPISPRRPGAVVVDPPNGRVPVKPAKVELGRVRRAMDSWEYQDPWERCISAGMPGRMLEGGTGGYNRGYEILQSPGYVVFFQEMIHNTRIIPVDGRPHVGSTIRLWHGDSRGHWEGNTLVIETTNFNDKGFGNGGRPQTEALRIVERITRVDAKTLDYQATFEDPNVYTRPWTARQPHNLDPGYVIYEYACHEGNTRYMTGVLTQGRMKDAEQAAAARKAAAVRKTKAQN